MMTEESISENGHDSSSLAVIDAEYHLVPTTAIEVADETFEELHGWPADADQRPYPVPSDETFEGAAYLPAADLADIASRLIAERSRFSHLRQFKIDYVWKRKGAKAKGVYQRGFCRLGSDLIAYYANVAFVIGLAADTCRDARFTYRQIEAAVHHELLHAGVHDETYTPLIWPHDFEGFELELEDYGIWAPGVAPRKSAKQMPLFEGFQQ